MIYFCEETATDTAKNLLHKFQNIVKKTSSSANKWGMALKSAAQHTDAAEKNATRFRFSAFYIVRTANTRWTDFLSAFFHFFTFNSQSAGTVDGEDRSEGKMLGKPELFGIVCRNIQ